MSHKDHVADLGVASGIATLNGSSTVVQNPASAQTTPAASKIPLSGAGSKLDKGWLPDFIASGASHAPGAVPDPPAIAGTTKFLREDATWAVPAPSRLTGQMIWVDSVNGNDGTGTRGQEDKPFLTISAALAATGITSGDVVYVRPGVYSLNAAQLTVPAGVSLVGVDRLRCQLTYSGAATVTLVTLNAGSSISFFDILPTPSAGVTTCVATASATAHCFRVTVNSGLSGNVIGLSVTTTGTAATGAMTARESVFLGNGTGSGLVVNGTGGTTRYASCNFDGTIGVTVTLGTARFERSRIGGTTGISVANSASASAVLDTATTVTNYTVGAAGTLTVDNATGPAALGAQVAFTGVVTPVQITSDQNDYSPTGLANAYTLRLSSDAARSITGLAGGTSGRVVSIINTGSNPITFVNESAASTAANRFALGGLNNTIVGFAIIDLTYDATISRWRARSSAGGATTPGGLVQSQWVEVVVDTATTATTWPLPTTTASGLVILPNTPINVASTAGFPTAGTLLVLTTAGPTFVTYTGTTAGSFTGCSGGTGTIIAGSLIYLYLKTTIAVGSNNVALPTGTINVASTTGFPASGKLLVTTNTGAQLVTYTGVGATTFTGCTGGSGTMNTGGLVANVTATTQDLIRVDLTTNGGALIIQGIGSISNATNNADVHFRVIVDGIVRRGGATKSNGGSSSTALAVSLKVSGLAAGAHTVVLQWRVGSGTGQVRPNTAEDENASLLVQEVSS